MIPVALILLGLVLLFSVAVVVSNPVPVTLSVFGAQIPLQTPAVYFTGAGAMLLVIVALGMLRIGLRRSTARRKELRALKKEAKTRGQVAASRPAAGAATTDSASAAAGSATTPGPTGGASLSAAATGSSSGPRDTAAAGPSGSAAPTGSSDAAATAGTSSDVPPSIGGTSSAAPAPRIAAADQHETTAAERDAWLAEVDDLTRDEPPR